MCSSCKFELVSSVCVWHNLTSVVNHWQLEPNFAWIVYAKNLHFILLIWQNKHGRHSQFLFLIGQSLNFFYEITWLKKPKLYKNHILFVLKKKRPQFILIWHQIWPSWHSKYDFLFWKVFFSLKQLSNLIGNLYGRIWFDGLICKLFFVDWKYKMTKWAEKL